MAIGPGPTTDCNDPAINGQSVGVVIAYVPDTNAATISIARVDPGTDETSVGPVVMTYNPCSDCDPVTTYGGGWLWIYDNSTTQGTETPEVTNPKSAELLQVSTSSGQVVNTVSVPKLFRPIMAANDDGLWIGNSIEGETCEGCSPPSTLYFVPTGSARAVVAIADTTSVVCWMLGSQDHLWAGIGEAYSGCSLQKIWRLDGTDFEPVFNVPDHGYHPNDVIGDESDSLWTMQWTSPPRSATPAPSPQEIVDINPNTGAEAVVATLPAITVPLTGQGEGLVQGQAAIFDGTLYLLEPPFRQNGYLGYSTLVRVTLPSSAIQ